ncbi:MAG: hypothetical protein V2J65_11985 [Desulfobacteraceae bacterium]|jgi:hypothetical protein|nr:hypothetical protein [Desulfobacteraceae bacterium]
MREWVKSFIKKEGILENYEDEDEVYDYLTEDFNLDFCPHLTSVIRSAFGSTLSDLPEDVFQSLKKMKNVFYSYIDDYYGEVKLFRLEHDIVAGDIVRFVCFPNHVVSLGFEILRGIIAHELAHVYLLHLSGNKEIEDEADNLAASWGFQSEINAFREHVRLLINRQKPSVS